jgi:5-methylcytosine-specific restriction endonuclease McrA
MAGMRKPFNKSTGRDYKSEYARYQGSAEQKKKRALRNNARRGMMREGRVRKGDGMEVDHKAALRNGGSNDKSNLRVIPREKNRAFKRTAANKPVGSA